jgi:two-component system, NtrC family, sensor histidine kinase HydH
MAGVELPHWVTLGAATGQLALGLYALRRAGRSSLALPLALLCLDIAAWNLADLAFERTRDPSWKLIDHALSPLTAPLLLHFVLVFTGMRRRLAGVLVAAYVPAAALAVSAVGAFFVPALYRFQRGDGWAFTLLAGSLPVVAVAVGALIVARREADLDARRRARVLLVAIALAVPLAATDVLEGVAVTLAAIPPLANLGMLVAAVLLATVALRLRLLGTDLSTSDTTFAGGLAALVGAGWALSVVLVPEHFVVGAAAAALLVAGLLVRIAVLAAGEQRARVAQLALLGRFTAQLSHDLKNPLAALKGGLQLLIEERRRGASLDASAGVLDLMLQQVERVQRAIDAHERLGRVEPTIETIDVNEVVRTLAALPPAGVTLRLELDEALPPARADRDLLARALENLLRNAVEATPAGGVVTVATRRDGAWVAVAVRDTGQGMDAMVRERALDDFFTTKAQGSGLGLPFAHRVAIAHGGALSVQSVVGRGTRVEITLPVGSARA